MLCRRHKTYLAGSLAAALALLAAGVAGADDTDQAIKRVIRLDQAIHIMALEFNGSPQDSEPLADRRVVDAQGLLARERTDEATTILLDVVTKWPLTRAAHDATFLLGDSLFRLGDFLSARSFYEKAILRFTGTKREQQALGRLVEIALRTGDFEPVDRYLRLLAQVPARALAPCVPYVKAKLSYYRGNLADATRIFGSIPPASPYSWRARYFLGTIKVKSGDLNAATAAFEAVLRTPAPDDDARDIQNLARLALARICFRQDRMVCARIQYLAIRPQPGSKVFADALYELGFAYVTSKDLDKAQDTFERLLHVDPEGAQVFEVKVLLGNLHLHRGNLGVARRYFSSAYDELGPGYDKLRGVMAKIAVDASVLDVLAKQGLDQIALGAFASPAARNWVRADPEVQRLLTLSSNIAGTPMGVADVKNTLRRIEGVLANPDSQTLFPDLTRVRSALTDVSVELLALRGPFLGRARRMEQPHLEESEARLLDRNGAEREGIERQLAARLIRNIPADESTDIPSSRYAVYQNQDRETPMSAPRPDVEKGQDRAGSLLVSAWRPRPPDQDSRFQTVGAQPSKELAIGFAATGERSAPVRLEKLLRQEQQIHQAVRMKMDPPQRARLDRDLEVLARADATLSQLVALDARIDAEIDFRLSAARDFVLARRQEVAAEDDKLAIVVGDAQNLGGSFVQVLCTRLMERVYDLVVRADVGLVDVAWASKKRATAVVTALQSDRNRELDALRATMKRQEAALARRFPVDTEATKWARLRLRMSLPDLTAH